MRATAAGSTHRRSASRPRRMLRMRAGILAVLTAGIALTQSSPQAQPPVFRSGTRLVQVNVVVHNKSGEPVADLKKEDFPILELGKPQQISFFSVDTAAPAAVSTEKKL